MNKRRTFPFRFNPQACKSCGGRCCRGSSGYVWISAAELKNMAAAHGMDALLFAKQHLRKVQGKLALQERVINGEHLCCFFDPVTCRCMVYEHRPEQCRTFPFWKKFQKNYELLLLECPGIVALDAANKLD
jgi:hypothetical protein